jgi:hypothetical protein
MHDRVDPNGNRLYLERAQRSTRKADRLERCEKMYRPAFSMAFGEQAYKPYTHTSACGRRATLYGMHSQRESEQSSARTEQQRKKEERVGETMEMSSLEKNHHVDGRHLRRDSEAE